MSFDDGVAPWWCDPFLIAELWEWMGERGYQPWSTALSRPDFASFVVDAEEYEDFFREFEREKRMAA